MAYKITFKKLIKYITYTKNDIFFSSVIPHIIPKHIEEKEVRDIYSLLVKYHKKYDKIPSISIIKTMFENSQTFKDLINDYLAVIREIDLEPIDALLENDDFRDDMIKQFLKTTHIKALAIQMYEMVETDSIDGNVEKVSDSIDVISSIDLDDDLGYGYIDEAKNRWNVFQTKANKIRSGSKQINDITYGGYNRKSETIITGVAGLGKTMWLVSEGAGILRENPDVNLLHLTLEIPDLEVARRYDSNFFERNMLKTSDLTEETYLKKIAQIDSRYNLKDRLDIKEYPMSTLEPTQLNSYIKKYLATGKKIDVLILDALYLMVEPTVKPSDTYNKLKLLSEKLRSIAQRYNIVLITAVQLDIRKVATKLNSSEIGMEHLSESQALNHTADFILALFTTDELYDMDIVELVVLKNRMADKTRGRVLRFITNEAQQRYFDYDYEEPRYDDNIKKGDDKVRASEGRPSKVEKKANESVKISNNFFDVVSQTK